MQPGGELFGCFKVRLASWMTISSVAGSRS